MIKKIALSALLISLSLFTSYLIFLVCVFIFIGLTNMDQPGSWMPIFCSLLLLGLSIFLIRLAVFIGRDLRIKPNYL